MCSSDLSQIERRRRAIAEPNQERAFGITQAGLLRIAQVRLKRLRSGFGPRRGGQGRRYHQPPAAFLNSFAPQLGITAQQYGRGFGCGEQGNKGEKQTEAHSTMRKMGTGTKFRKSGEIRASPRFARCLSAGECSIECA